MNTHPYLRAYMAGIVVPTLVLLLVLSGFVIARLVCRVPLPIERVIVFPMALVPNMFGLWNMFYLWLRPRPHLPIGLHGALLPFLLAPCGLALASGLGFVTLGSRGLMWLDQLVVPYPYVAVAFAVGLIVYYLVWKYLVGFFNQMLGIA
ncbi:MAG: hypothetical protein WBQ09_08430 [Terriglobales bacterium]|jgi:hypothetical protein